MILNERNKEIIKGIPDDIYDLLINQFDKKEGMPNQETYAPLKRFDIKSTKEEIELLDKYNYLDDKGKHTINTVLNIEYNRCKDYLTPIAAHDKEGNFSEEDIKYDNDIMNDDKFWNK